MKTKYLIIILFILFSCQKEDVKPGKNVSEFFYLENKGASMPVIVEGNTESKVFIIYVHGGPGGYAGLYNTEYVTNNIESEFACVYWDQRNSGATEGTFNSKYFTLKQMAEDLKYLILVVKKRYGNDSKVFILSHSFGGMLTSEFLSVDDNQKMIAGWINADGVHNNKLNDSLTIKMLKANADEQLSENNNIEFWTEVKNYCNSIEGELTFNQFIKINSFAHSAENYFEEIKPIIFENYYNNLIFKDKFPITLKNLNNLGSILFSSEIHIDEVNENIFKINIPVLMIYGKYDFVCPAELGKNLFDNIISADKSFIIFEFSGHSTMFNEEENFYQNVKNYIYQHL